MCIRDRSPRCRFVAIIAGIDGRGHAVVAEFVGDGHGHICLLYTSGVLEPILSSVVVTENSWRERVMPADELEKIAVDVFGRDRVIKEANLPDACLLYTSIRDRPEAS